MFVGVVLCFECGEGCDQLSEMFGKKGAIIKLLHGCQDHQRLLILGETA